MGCSKKNWKYGRRNSCTDRRGALAELCHGLACHCSRHQRRSWDTIAWSCRLRPGDGESSFRCYITWLMMICLAMRNCLVKSAKGLAASVPILPSFMPTMPPAASCSSLYLPIFAKTSFCCSIHSLAASKRAPTLSFWFLGTKEIVFWQNKRKKRILKEAKVISGILQIEGKHLWRVRAKPP